MSKLFKLKEWLSLKNAAIRLSNSFEENVLIDDILQLALEDRIELCWLLNNQLVCEAKYSLTLMLGENDTIEFNKYNKIPKKYALIPSEIPDNTVFKVQPSFDSFLTKVDTVLLGGIRIIGEQFHTDGAYKIDLNTGAMKAYISDWLTGKKPEWTSMDGMMLKSNKNKLYQPVELLPLTKEEQKETGKYSIFDGTPYPSAEIPELSEIVILRSDLEKFEQSFNKESDEKPTDPIDMDSEIFKTETLISLLGSIKKGVNGYPSWRDQQRFKNKIQMSELDEWLYESITTTKRDAETVKKIIIEIFKL